MGDTRTLDYSSYGRWKRLATLALQRTARGRRCGLRVRRRRRSTMPGAASMQALKVHLSICGHMSSIFFGDIMVPIIE